MSPIAANLRLALDRADMNARELADKIGVAESTVSLWLSGGRVPRVKNLEKIASALGLELADLWEGPEATPASPAQQAVIDDMAGMTPAQQEAVAGMVRAIKLAGSP